MNMEFKLELRDNRQTCVCSDCGAWYYLDDPSGFKHTRRCKYKKHGNGQIDDKFTSWQHNVIDEYKSLSTEEIRQKLAEKQLPFAVAMENWQGDFNLATVIRNANAFGVRRVFYLGTKKGYDRRGTVGTHNYTDVTFLSSVEELTALRDQYKTFVGIDNVPGSVAMETYQWQPESLLILGEEGPGLTSAIIKVCDAIVAIEMRGSVRSLNAGVASGIAMFDFTNRLKR